MMNLIDKNIIQELSKDARQTNSKIGKKLGLSQQVISYRIKRLVETGVIEQFHTVIRIGYLGFSNYTVMIKLSSVSQEKKKTLIKELQQEENIALISECGGKWDFICELQAKNSIEFQDRIGALAEKYDEYISYYTVFLTASGSFFGRKYSESDENTFMNSAFGSEEPLKVETNDLRILSILATNSRATSIEIGQKTGTHYKTVSQRIKYLKESGIIRSFAIRVNLSCFGVLSHRIFLELKKLTKQKEKELLKFLSTKKGIVGTTHQIGKYNYAIGMETRSQEDTWALYEEIQAHLGNNIQNIELIPIFKKHNYNYFPASLLKSSK
jgi:DNA-binding Lrp family transcriptional regulator